jgi:hypothetical protein
MRYLIVLACLLIAAAEALATEVTFPGAVAEGYPKIAEVTGYLVFPTKEAKGKVPAVVILHGSSGIGWAWGISREGAQCGRHRHAGSLDVYQRQSAPRRFPLKLHPYVWRLELPGKPTRHRSSAHRCNGFFLGRRSLFPPRL